MAGKLRIYRTLVVSTLVVGLAAVVGSSVLPLPIASIKPAGSDEIQPAANARENVRLNQSERNAVLAEMRTMLRSVSRIVHGLARGDLAMVETAARASGMAIAMSPQLQAKVPGHFIQLDVRMHRRFDELGNAAKRNDNVLTRLAAITGYCVSCHDTYQIEETR